MEDAVKAFSLKHPAAEKKLVAVSGGLDSVSLLQALVEAGHRRLVVCHLDHRLRGRASSGDARFVQQLAARLDLPIEMEREDVAAEAAQQRISVEMAGRRARHRFFGLCARRHRCRLVLLAHHGTDQAETVLFNLFRGSAGLRGMKAETPMLVPGCRKPLILARPLLEVTRCEIEAWSELRGVRYREDASNASPDYVRNRIRHELLPAISGIMGRDVLSALCRAAALASAESDWLDEQAAALACAEELDVKALRLQPEVMQRRIIHLWLNAQQFTGVTAAAVEAVRSLLPAGVASCAVNLPGNRFVRRSKAKLRALP